MDFQLWEVLTLCGFSFLGGMWVIDIRDRKVIHDLADLCYSKGKLIRTTKETEKYMMEGK